VKRPTLVGLAWLAALGLPLGLLQPTGAMAAPEAPRAAQIEHWVKSPHGDRRDEYHWLRDDSPKAKRPAVMRHLRAENAYTAARMAPLAARQRALLAEMKARVVPDDTSVPRYDNGWWYQHRHRPGAEHPQLWRRPGTPQGPHPAAREQLVLDEAARARGQPYYAVGAWAVSPDGRLLAWTEDLAGRRRHTLHVKDLNTGRLLPTRLSGVLEDIAWANDNRTIFHIRQDPKTLNSGPVWRWRLGEPPPLAKGRIDESADGLVHDEADRTLFVGLRRSASGRHILIQLDSEDTGELLSVDADAPESPARVRIARSPGVRVHADHLGAAWIVRSNRNAPDYALWAADDTTLASPAQWQQLRPQRPGSKLQRFVLHERGVAFDETANAEPRVRWLALPRLADATAPLAAVLAGRSETALGGLPGHTARLDEEPLDPRAERVRWTLTSMVLPLTTLDFDPASGDSSERRRERVPGFEASRYASDRFWAVARDGTRVPVTLAWRRDRGAQDGRAPLLVRGYGAYGLSFDPEFRPQRLSLLDRGFVLAIAHVRGGSELGEAWYAGGRLANKRNTFTDFIDATQALVDAGWGDAERVFAEGGSAGGLLMGVVANEAGRLYRGIVMQVPFVDVVTTMLDGSLPLTEQEWTQWGDPRRADDYARMLAYSPYDRIAAQDYPPMLVTAGLWDAQVPYHEPAKFVARLRTKKTDSNPLLLHTELEAGHGGASGRYAGLEQVARWTLFVIDLAEVEAGSVLAPKS
jgi:oligopeptidase B